MGLLELLGFRRPARQGQVDAGSLGSLHWVEDEESWRGSIGGIEFFVFPEGSAEEPSNEVIEYAKSVLMDIPWLEREIEAGKQAYIAEHPEFGQELSELGIAALAFSVNSRRGQYLNCQLGYGSPDRFWSIDFHGREFSGIGFDS